MISNIYGIIKSTIKKVIPLKYHRYARGKISYLESLLYIGSKYSCPLCNGSYRRFLPAGLEIPELREKQVVGGGYRENCHCPRCRSAERTRLMGLYLKDMQGYFEEAPRRILHFAPEYGLQQFLKSMPNVEYVSADLMEWYADEIIDVTDIPYDNEHYDLIICSHVLEHVIDDKKAISEIFRVLKPNGIAFLQVPISITLQETFEDKSITSPNDRERYFGQNDHVRLYGQDYTTRLEACGFSVNIVDPMEYFTIAAIQRYGLLKEEKLYIGKK